MTDIDPSKDTILGNAPALSHDDLREKYPAIFSKKCEISVGEGWIPTLDRMCNLIQRHKDMNDHMGYTQVVAVQVKQKYGGLRFYYNSEPQVHLNDNTRWSDWRSWVDGVISMTEAMCRITCENCGAPGKGRVSGGYYYVSCDKHILEPRL